MTELAIDLQREARELEQLKAKVILSPAAKRRLEELPGLVAAEYARAEAEAEAKAREEQEFMEHFEGAVEQYIDALRHFVETKETLDTIRAAGKTRGLYMPRIEVRAAQDRQLYKLLESARATALA